MKTFRTLLLFCFLMMITSSGFCQIIVPDGLVAYYPFSGNADDASGHNYHGTVYGATLCPDQYGNANSAYSYSSDYISLPSDALNNIPSGTFSAYVLINTLNQQHTLIDKTITFSINYFQVIIDQANKLRVIISNEYGTGTNFFFSKSTFTTGSWYDVAVTWNSQSLSMFINGNLDTSYVTSAGIPDAINPVLLGKADNNTAYIDGSLDEVRIYNRILTGNELECLYANMFPAQAGPIFGPLSACPGTTGAVFTVNPVSNAESYAWTLPPGFNITGGAGTNSITVDIDSTAVSGNVSVAGVNTCGNGPLSDPYPVTVHPVPPTPEIFYEPYGYLNSDAPDGNQWYRVGWPDILSDSQYYQPEYNAEYYYDRVVLNGCPSYNSNIIYCLFEGIPELEGGTLTVSPIPNAGKFTVSCSGLQTGTYQLRLADLSGKILFSKTVTIDRTSVKIPVEIHSVPDGIYALHLFNPSGRLTTKIVISQGSNQQ